MECYKNFSTYTGRIRKIWKENTTQQPHVLVELYNNPKLPSCPDAYFKVMDYLGNYLSAEGFVSAGEIHFTFILCSPR